MKNGLATVITCDTHVLLFWALAPQQLSPTALNGLERAAKAGALACADIVLWEIALLAHKQRIRLSVPTGQFIEDLLQGLRLVTLPITPAIAVRAQADFFQHKDPADRLIAATALAFDAPLITRDRKLALLPGLRVIW